MIPIRKKSAPWQLLEYSKIKGASYSDMHGAKIGNEDKDVYTLVLEALMKEQGHLCAYCMRRIPESKGNPNATIEHIIPQSEDNTKALDYRNMLAVCSGNRTCKDDNCKTCDARRGNRKLSMNPLKTESILSIKYKSSGCIYSEEDNVDRELNDVLNLNCVERNLPNSRKRALAGMIVSLNKKGKDKDKLYLKRLLATYQRNQNVKDEYVGILIWWLKRHI